MSATRLSYTSFTPQPPSSAVIFTCLNNAVDKGHSVAPQLKTERPKDLTSELASIGDERAAEAAAKVAREEYGSWLATMETLR